MTVQANSAQNRKVGLDTPCGMCSGVIYFNYRGPIDGICGKCTDDLRTRLGGRCVTGGQPRQRSRVAGFGLGALVCAFVAGCAAAVAVIYSGVLPV